MIDTFRLVPTPGAGVLARFPGIVLLAAPVAGNDEASGPLLAACRDAAGSGPFPARKLARLVASLIGSDDGTLPPFCTIADAEGGGLAVVAHGDMDVAFLIDGVAVLVSGGESLTWVDRVVTGRVATARGGPAAAVPDASALRMDINIDSGVVPAGGFVMSTDEAARVDPPRPPLTLGDADSFKSVLLTDAAPTPGRVPLPLASEVLSEAARGAPDDRIVQGIQCSRGHFTDPANLYCAVCGISMAQKTQVLVDGIRPALGFLVLDDATTYSLDRDYVVGREPHLDDRVSAQSARGLVLDDGGHTVSRVHAEVRLDGWHVRLLDRGSTNGTFIWDETNSAWQRIDPGQPERIRPGMRIAFGQRTARFESPHDHRHT